MDKKYLPNIKEESIKTMGSRQQTLNAQKDKMSIYKFLFNHRAWRISKASKFGKIEHKAGRLLGLFTFLTIILIFFGFHKTALYMAIINFITWITYLSAHTIEKKLYGHFGPRG